MFQWLTNLLLVKEIKSKEGIVHFRRWRFFSSPWFRIYLHKICRSDLDKHLHTHPWNFISLILNGGYTQKLWGDYTQIEYQTVKRFDTVKMGRYDGHHITLTKCPTWTLVFAYGKYKEWGYLTKRGFINNIDYRSLKNSGELND